MKKYILVIAIIILGAAVISAPVFAECPEGSVPTAILGDGQGSNGERCMAGTNDGSAIGYILKTVMEVMTIGVGILGVLGIVIVGIQYLTAGGNTEQTVKAKRRLVEIVIGLVVFVSLNAIISFLVPNSTFDTSQIKYEGKSTPAGTFSNSSSSKASTSSNNITSQAEKEKKVKKLINTVVQLAWPKFHDSRSKGKWLITAGHSGTYYSKAKKKYSQWAGYTSSCDQADCGLFISALMHHSGYDPSYSGKNTKTQYKYLKNSSNWKKLNTDKLKLLGNEGLEPGDLVKTMGKGHVFIYVGTIYSDDGKKFNSKFVEASYCNYVAMSSRPGRRDIKEILSKPYDKPEGYAEGEKKIYYAVYRHT